MRTRALYLLGSSVKAFFRWCRKKCSIIQQDHCLWQNPHCLSSRCPFHIVGLRKCFTVAVFQCPGNSALWCMSYPNLTEPEKIAAHTEICCATDSMAHLSFKFYTYSIFLYRIFYTSRFLLKNIETFLLFWSHLLVVHRVISSFIHESYE